MSAAATKRREAHIKKKYGWLHAELKAKRGLSWNHGNSTVPGTRIIEATYSETPCAIGILWYRHGHSKGVIEILSIFVVDYYRRCGIATFMLEKLIGSFPATREVTTGDGTEYGAPWMRANGFKKTSAGEWAKAVKPTIPAKKKRKARRCRSKR